MNMRFGLYLSSKSISLFYTTKILGFMFFIAASVFLTNVSG